MNSTLPSKLKYLSSSLIVVTFVAVASLGHLGAQQPSAVTLPLKVDSDLDGVSIEVTSVQKAGDTITIRFKYINTRDKPANIANESRMDTREIYYVDAKNKKKYGVVKDASGNLVSSQLYSIEVPAGGTTACWAKFPAPSPDVTTISIYLPGAPPFENVPIAQ